MFFCLHSEKAHKIANLSTMNKCAYTVFQLKFSNFCLFYQVILGFYPIFLGIDFRISFRLCNLTKHTLAILLQCIFHPHITSSSLIFCSSFKNLCLSNWTLKNSVQKIFYIQSQNAIIKLGDGDKSNKGFDFLITIPLGSSQKHPEFVWGEHFLQWKTIFGGSFGLKKVTTNTSW